MTLVDRACVIAVIAAAGALGFPSAARAQSAEAEALFRDGRNLIKQGKIAPGCDKLAASERLESSVGTLLNLGDCREKLGKLASAWAAFRKAEAMARRSGDDIKRQTEAARRAAQLEPRLSNLVIEVPARVEGLVVRRDGELVDAAQWSTPVPVDPGSYTIIAEAPGYLTWRTTAQITPGSKRQLVTVPGLERAPAPPPPEPGAVAVVSPDAAPVPRPIMILRPAGTWSAMRKVSLAVGLAGAGALGTGIYYGWRANDLQERADRRCPLVICNDPDALRFNDQARTSATRANILYIAGGATLATALVLWLVGAPDETVVAPTAGAHQLGVTMTGSF
jgi:hypothetical protein